jgi:hypothetical protein
VENGSSAPLPVSDDVLRSLDQGLVTRCNGGREARFLVLIACTIALAGVAPEAMAAGAKRGPLVKLGDSQFGRVLFSRGDRALYLFTRDPRNKTAATATAPRRGRPSSSSSAARGSPCTRSPERDRPPFLSPA